jgi:DtxR family Mn-dependent transcriptional regulator
MSELIDTTEMYLKAIYELQESGHIAVRARIAERLDQAAPTVSQTVARMERDGLVVLEADKALTLTEYGSELAIAVMRKHRLAERLLIDVLGFDWASCHEEACHWEHVISDEAEIRIAQKLNTLTHDPFGNPIPGLEELGFFIEPFLPSKKSISEMTLEKGDSQIAKLIVIGESAQAREGFLQSLVEAGISLNSDIEVSRTETGLTIKALSDKQVIKLDRLLAEYLYIASS